MECQILFSGKNKKNVINLLSAELAQSGKGLKYFHQKKGLALHVNCQTILSIYHLLILPNKS